MNQYLCTQDIKIEQDSDKVFSVHSPAHANSSGFSSMEDKRWIDEDAINKNMLSDEDRQECQDSCSFEFPNLETQESTTSDKKSKYAKGCMNKKNGLHKRSNKNG